MSIIYLNSPEKIKSMNVEEGVIYQVRGDRAKVKIGKSRIKEVKLNPQDGYEEGDYVKIMMGLIVCKA